MIAAGGAWCSKLQSSDPLAFRCYKTQRHCIYYGGVEPEIETQECILRF